MTPDLSTPTAVLGALGWLLLAAQAIARGRPRQAEVCLGAALAFAAVAALSGSDDLRPLLVCALQRQP